MRDKSFSAPNIKQVLIALMVAAVCGGLLWLLLVFAGEDSNYEFKKTIRYSFLVSNNTADFVNIATLEVFAPVQQNSYQKTLRVDATHDFELIQDELKNQSLAFELTNLAPYSSRVISVTAELMLASAAQPFATEGDFISSEPNIEANAPEILALAEKISAEGNPPRRISNWIYQNIADVGYISEDRGALYAVTEKQGDCTEFASSFVALVRAGGSQARMIGGFTTDGSGKLNAENYHNWAEFKLKNTWLIADPQKNIVDSGYGSYIAFYNFNKRSRMKSSHRFLSYDQRLSVQML